MKKFIIKRAMTGVSGAPKHELDKAGKASEAVLIEMRAEGKEIQQEQSYVAGDTIYCIYSYVLLFIFLNQSPKLIMKIPILRSFNLKNVLHFFY